MSTLSYKGKALSPIIPIADMGSSIRFYTDVLGFDAAMHSEAYSILTKDGASLHLTRAEEQSVLDATKGAHVDLS